MDHTSNIAGLFKEAAKSYPGHIAIIEKQREMPYEVLEQKVVETAAYFLRKGIQKGDRVLVLVPMSTDLYRIVLALMYVGATAVFLDEWVGFRRMEACCRLADCKAMIGGFKIRIMALLSSELRKIPVKLRLNPFVSFGEQTPEMEAVSGSDTALITFTTGSTGIPKAANRTHGFLKEQFQALTQIIQPSPADIDMPVLPIVLFINLGIGCTSVIPEYKASKPKQLDPSRIIGLINRHGITRMVASPYFVKTLAEYLVNHPGSSVRSLKKLFTGGGPVFPSEASLFQMAFPETRCEIVFGSTEAEPISTITAEKLSAFSGDARMKGLPVGRPVDIARVRIISIHPGPVVCNNPADLDRITLQNGQIGEVIVSGPHVLTSYYQNEEARKENKIFVNQTCWHRTGDSGFLDNSGNLFLTGRCNSLIVKDGTLYAPFVYENLLQQIPGITSGTLVLKDNLLFAVAETKPEANPSEISRRIHELIPGAGIQFVSKIPRDPRHHTKIDYASLRKLIP